MKKFEYLVVEINKAIEQKNGYNPYISIPEKIQRILNEYGEDGWELVQIVHDCCYFKREE